MQGRTRLLFFACFAVVSAAAACNKQNPSEDQLLPAPDAISRPPLGDDDDDDDTGLLPDPVTATSSGGSGAHVNADGCSELTASSFTAESVGDGLSIYVGAVESGNGHTAGFTLLFVTDQARTEDLGSELSRNYATCEYCTYADDASERIYFQKSGTLTVDASSDIYTGVLHATLTDATYIEAEFDDDLNTVPVEGGGCVHVASAAIDVGD